MTVSIASVMTNDSERSEHSDSEHREPFYRFNISVI